MTAQEMIKKFRISLADGNAIRALGKPSQAQVAEIKAAKDEIVAILKAERDAKEKAKAERDAKIAAIAGLNEIETAIGEWETYRYKFDRAMENGDCRYPSKPTSSIDELKARYPRAAAYIKAESYTYAANYAKAAAGNKALERIINGEDYEQVLADMESEWSEAAHEAVNND